MSLSDDLRALKGVNAPPAIERTIRSVIQVQENQIWANTPMDDAVLWLLRECGKRVAK